MMSYTVCEDDKPATMAPNTFKCWEIATFDTKREAEIYAYLWCYPVTRDVAEKEAPQMKIGVAYDYGMFEVPVWMKIVEEE
jgi:hypothetical protein